MKKIKNYIQMPAAISQTPKIYSTKVVKTSTIILLY